MFAFGYYVLDKGSLVMLLAGKGFSRVATLLSLSRVCCLIIAREIERIDR